MLRGLTRRDLADLQVLSEAAGWNQVPADWERLLRLAPDTCFGIEAEGRVVASATVLPYGNRVAWLGMVLTHPAARRQGYARSLLQHILGLPLPALMLDATAEGQPLYESLGFVALGELYRYRREPTAPEAVAEPCSGVRALDDFPFGANRQALLAHLVREGRLYQEAGAYCIVRAGRLASHLGPMIASTPQQAQRILERVTQAEGQVLIADLHPTAVDLFEAHGFQRTRTLQRMVRGRALEQDPRRVYAAAGFELG
jgi:GNAT superfamily N-acetyltransferase